MSDYRVDQDQRLDELVSHAVAWLRTEGTASYSKTLAHMRAAGASDDEADAAVMRGLATGRLVRVGVTGLLRAA